ncbi:MAG: menaquinone biosynthesis protein [Bacteroidetes bacterium]|nr:menaquinone biosynthesis protein [Bacteroidota bacterium]
MKPLRISVIPFLNSRPFIYGLKHSGFLKNPLLSFDTPSRCAAKLSNGEADIGLVPSVVIPYLKKYRIITDYCIGSCGNVRSVLLVSNTPRKMIKTVYLDHQSLTSVILTRILADKYWKMNVGWIPMKKLFLKKKDTGKGFVFIGDRALSLRMGFRYVYDLSNEWKKFTGLPFVFACWVARVNISNKHLENFRKAVEYGLAGINKVIEEQQPGFRWMDVRAYLTKSISFKLDRRKISGMNLFWKYSKNYFDENGKLLEM